MHASGNPGDEYVLGLDIGVSSVGWCLLEQRDGNPRRILAMGSRIFPAGVEGSSLDIHSGRDSPRNAKRRQARQMRRQLWRRRRRMLKLHRALVRHGLLPEPAGFTPEAIDRSLKQLDAQIAAADPLRNDRLGASLVHYRLRARALDEPLAPHSLGRALYHLAQRRGFLSNRKAKRSDDEESVVKDGIASLQRSMSEGGARTIGEYFSRLDPEQARIRGRWLDRVGMVLAEFRQICDRQAAHHLAVTGDGWKEIEDAIFRQRPLRDQSHLIGRCSLEPREPRCATAHPVAQLFRILQSVNHLRLVTLEDGLEVSERALTAEERSLLVAQLRACDSMTVAAVRKLLGEKPGSSRLSIERGGEKKIYGDRTSTRIREIIGVAWDDLSDESRAALTEDLLEYEMPAALEKRLLRRWRLPRDQAAALCEVSLERTPLAFSLKGLHRLVPLMATGLSVTEAKMTAYPAQAGSDAPWEFVPPVRPDRVWKEHCSHGRAYNGLEIRNPAVERSLAEVRRVVNGIIRRWGRPSIVRIELARDLKKPHRERAADTKRMREQEGRRGAALAKMVEEGFGHIAERSARSDVEKALLWEECGGVCPYTGASISFESLFGPSPSFEIEHIIPFSRSLEDGFGNKTLCAVAENRNHKRNRTPHEAYAGTPAWDAIIGRVRHFTGPAARRKLRLFLSETAGEDVFGDFVSRQLNDTRYAARLAGDYLGLLYGGQVDADGVRRIQVSTGGATAIVRRKLGLEGMLGEGEKNRKDHRHHAVDALAIALTGPRTVKEIAAASQAAIDGGTAAHRLVLQHPWESFTEDARRHLDAIVVSHRASRRLSGPVHLETNYSRPILDHRGRSPGGARHIRRPLNALGRDDVKAIVDPIVRRAVEDALARCGTDDPKAAFKSTDRFPTLTHSDGRDVPIRRVRVRVGKTVEAVGDGATKRYVAPGSNHHMAIVKVRTGKGSSALELHVVTMLDAYRRHSRGQPIVQRDWGSDGRLVCTLRNGDSVELDIGGTPTPCIVGSVSDGLVELKVHRDARPATEIRQGGRAGGRLQLTTRQFTDSFRRKLEVSPLGEVRLAHD